MANDFIKAEKVVRQGLGLLEREIVVPGLVFKNGANDFDGAKDDTISLRVPAYATARSRTLRGGRPITMDELHETKVDVTLDADIYKAVPITDEQLSLDIVDFGEQVNQPVVKAVARGVEDTMIAEMVDATYEVELEIDTDDPYLTLVDARTALNDARVPMQGRACLVGSAIENRILKSEHLSKFDLSGSSEAFREAVIGRIAGFTAITVPGLPPDFGVAFHATAFALALRAPKVPEGATWGQSASFAGLAMRVLRDYDFLNVQDRFLADVFIGTNIVQDHGEFNSHGQFVPSEEPDTDEGTDLIFVRAVSLALNES